MLFGHQNDDTNQPVPSAPDAAGVNPLATGVNPLAVDPATGVSLPVPPAPDEPADSAVASAPLVTPSPAPVVEPTEPAASDAPVSPASSLDDDPEPAVAPSSRTRDDQTSDDDTPPAGDDLLNMKQQALAQLSPLVGQLDQTAEEKFRTTMMLIQSTDNQSLLKDAYDAAQRITDEKARAQALLDVVNEINYFTQQKN